MSYGVQIGTAIVSYIEPHAGHEVEFNRWYERDHFPATVKAGPGVFSGARFVATRACKELRPPGGRLFGDPARGSHLGVAWVLPGKQAEWDAWVAKEMETIAAEDRLFPYRDHVHTAIYRVVEAREDADVALDRGAAGVIVLADTGQVPGLDVMLELERTVISAADPPPHRLAIGFCTVDPLEAFAAERPAFEACGFASPFLATVPGTDRYADEL
jgi:hypothetical protein